MAQGGTGFTPRVVELLAAGQDEPGATSDNRFEGFGNPTPMNRYGHARRCHLATRCLQ